jgi:EAL domain-containing protein (putative c-di-GMP-specific phosphodiesterase class I)
VYQPIYDCSTRKLTGFEALARWNHPQRGDIAPDVFIRIAEETGLIVPLGTWALTEACRTLASWRTLDPASEALVMHVNVSGAQLAQADFTDTVCRVLCATGVDPHQLVIEITETILIEKRSLAIPHLKQLRELGASISIDDFGTGYSSFSLLHQLPVDEIKIDRMFIDQLGASEQGDAVVATMLALGQTLGKAVVAEGVETATQLARLADMRCTQCQGFLFGQPLTADRAAALLQETHRQATQNQGGDVASKIVACIPAAREAQAKRRARRSNEGERERKVRVAV